MSSTGGSAVSSTPLRTASVIVAGAVPGSHDLKIKGYSHTKGYLNGKYIKAETFTLGGHRWYMRYFPNGCCSNDDGWVTFFLYHHRGGGDEVKVQYKISLLDQDGNPVPSHVNYNTNPDPCANPTCGIGLIKRGDLEGSAYLRDDTFSVRSEFTVLKVFTDSVMPDEVPSSDMHLHLGGILSSGELTDVTLEVGEETFRAHKCVLAARSSVFMAEFSGPMKEKTAASVKIDDMEPKVLKAMLRFIYTDSLPHVDEGDMIAMIQHLLVAADRYNIKRLKLICEDKLRSNIDTSMVASTLALAEQHDCRQLKQACFKFLTSPGGNLKDFVASGGLEQLMSSCPLLVKELVTKIAS